MRNGQRWHVVKIDRVGDRIAARRIGDGALAVFSGDYLHQHVHHGYAVTVHAAQGATAERCHAVLSATGNRAGAYVAMTRGRDSNTVYLYDRVGGEGDHEHAEQVEGVHLARRGDNQDAAQALLNLLGRDNTVHTVIGTATHTGRDQLPEEVQKLLDTRERALEAARIAYEKPQLAAEIDWLAVAGRGWSPAGAYGVAAYQVAHLNAHDRDVVTAIAHSMSTVQSLHLSDDTTKAELLAAIAAGARANDKPLLVIPVTEQARHDAAHYAAKVNIHNPEEVLTTLDNTNTNTERRRRLIGALFVVDDADHLAPDQRTDWPNTPATTTSNCYWSPPRPASSR